MAKPQEPVTIYPNNNPTAIDIIYQDLHEMQARYAALEAQVQRMQKVFKLDEREAAVGEQQSRTELIRAIQNNTTTLERFIKINYPDNEQDMFIITRQNKQRGTAKGLKETIKLKNMRQEVSKICPCGKHRGIKFINENGELILHSCPINWWVRLSRIAWEEGRIKQFHKETPLDVFLKPFLF